VRVGERGQGVRQPWQRADLPLQRSRVLQQIDRVIELAELASEKAQIVRDGSGGRVRADPPTLLPR
jgi:hypothetical protein